VRAARRQLLRQRQQQRAPAGKGGGGGGGGGGERLERRPGLVDQPIGFAAGVEGRSGSGLCRVGGDLAILALQAGQAGGLPLPLPEGDAADGPVRREQVADRLARGLGMVQERSEV